MTALALAVAVLALIVATIALAALLEMYTSLTALTEGNSGRLGKQGVILLEEHTKRLIARPVSDIGLSIPSGKPSWYVLFLSSNCRTCSALADSLAASMPEMLSLVVLGADIDAGKRWMSSKGLPLDRYVMPDPAAFEQTGILISPSILVVIEDEMAYLAGLESVDSLHQVIHEKYMPSEVLPMRAGVSANERVKFDQAPTHQG